MADPPPRPAYPAADEYEQRYQRGTQALGKAKTIAPPEEPSWPRWILSLLTGYPATAGEEFGPADLAMAAPLVPGARRITKGLGSLAKTLKTTGQVGEYALRAPAVERIDQLYDIGRRLPGAADWSGAQHEELLRAFGGDEARALQWARLWAANSPNTSVPVTTRESVSALAHALLYPDDPLTVDYARRLPGAKITMAPSKVPNINRALAGEPLGGDKVEAMAGLMMGQNRAPLDVHALYGVGSEADKLDTELRGLRALMTDVEGLPLRGGLTDTDLYLRYEQALLDALGEIAPRRQPAFPTFWEGVRAHKGLKPQGGPIDILRKKGLLAAGAMLDPKRLRAALAKSGWTAGAISGLLATLEDERVGAPPPSPPRGQEP